MTFYEKVKSLCEIKGISITSLAMELGFSKSAGTTWKKSSGMPRNSTVKKISEYFGVPITYFSPNETVSAQTMLDNHGIIDHTHAPIAIINGTEKKLTEQELALLGIFTKLDVVNQAKLLAYASELKKEV